MQWMDGWTDGRTDGRTSQKIRRPTITHQSWRALPGDFFVLAPSSVPRICVDKDRYPFCFTRKEEETSWRSSIRHALFQRWFVKVQPFTTDQNSGGGRNNFRNPMQADNPRSAILHTAVVSFETAWNAVRSHQTTMVHLSATAEQGFVDLDFLPGAAHAWPL
ncbi:uncharacterized protein LOC144112715 isoform X5 [Amblyomma americanum]